jgi:hypothetical protein
MNIDHKRFMMRRFPYLERAIETSYQASAEFRSLCGDYVDAVTTLARLEDAMDETQHARAAEYKLLVKNLEAEILLELYRKSSG